MTESLVMMIEKGKYVTEQQDKSFLKLVKSHGGAPRDRARSASEENTYGKCG